MLESISRRQQGQFHEADDGASVEVDACQRDDLVQRADGEGGRKGGRDVSKPNRSLD